MSDIEPPFDYIATCRVCGVRDLLFGINTMVDALVSMIEENTDAQ